LLRRNRIESLLTTCIGLLGRRDSTGYLDWKKAQLAVLPNLKPSTQTISLRLPQHLLDSIKTAANARDVPYQSLIKVWLQEKLEDS
jgi:predicted DNA binding CopG/RHH family protein